MNKMLKSFHKLFFIIIFSVLFSIVIGNSTTPKLPDKIAEELDRIEALPRKEKAVLNIEVTKIKSEFLEEIYIDRKDKNIYVDFSKKKEKASKVARTTEELEQKYKLIVTETVESSSIVNGKPKNSLKNSSQSLNYTVEDLNGKKMLKIPFDTEPEKLYITIQERGTEKVAKVYNLDIKKAVQLNRTKDTNKFKYSLNLNEIIIPKSYTSGGLTVKGGEYKIEQLELFGNDGKTQIFPMIGLGAPPSRYAWLKSTILSTGGSFEAKETPPKVILYFGQGNKGSYAYIKIKNIPEKQYVPNYMLLYLNGTSSKYNAISCFRQGVNISLECELMLYISDSDIQYIKKTNATNSNKQLLNYSTNSNKSIYITSGKSMANGSLELPVYKNDIILDNTNEIISNAYPDIYIEKDDTMEINTSNLLKEIIIEDEENLTFEYNYGSLSMKEVSTYIPNGEIFPLITLGQQFPKNGAGWGGIYSGNGNTIPTMSSRESVYSNYKNSSGNFIQLLMYLKNSNSNGSTIIKRGNPENMIGSYKLNMMETVSGDLYGKIQDENALKSIISSFRESPEEMVTFKSSEDLDKQISFVIGQYTTTRMSIPVEDNLTNYGEEKIRNYKYPDIKIKKTKLDENVTLTLKDNFDMLDNIQVTASGTSNSNVTVVAEGNKNLYLKSLWYQSLIMYKNSETVPITSTGNTAETILDIKDSTNTKNMKISIKYNNRYPNIKILKLDGEGDYSLNIKHLDPSKLLRRDYNLKIVVPNTYKTQLFKNDYINNEIVIDGRAPIVDGKPISIENPDIFVNVEQLSTDAGIFPVIAINNENKWQIVGSSTPLNPVDYKAEARIRVGTKVYAIPVNLKETPYQTPQKFFIYNRGEMTKKNLALGAYNNIGANGTQNFVRGKFEINLSEEIKKEMINYAKGQSGVKVTFPYEGTDNKIYVVKGIQENKSDRRFSVLGSNIISTFDFPAISVIKNEYTNINKVDLKFINPIPKSYGEISGTFDIDSNGNKKPNDLLSTLNHPESLSITNMTSSWKGYSILNYKHKIKIYLNTNSIPVKEIETDYNGNIKEPIEINIGNNNYILTKGKNSGVAIGIKKWDFNAKTSPDIIRLDHENQFDRVFSKDTYSITIDKALDLNIYHDKDNSTVFSNNTMSGMTMSIVSTVSNIKSTDIGGLKLQNYDKGITQTNSDSVGVRIEVPTEELKIYGNNIKGVLRFEGGRTSITNPNEFGTLRFIVTQGESSISAGYNHVINTIYLPNGTTESSSLKGLIRIKSGDKVVKLVDYINIKWTNTLPDKFQFFDYSSTLKNLEIKDTDKFNDSIIKFNLEGIIAISQTTSGSSPDQSNIIPALALGERKNWERYQTTNTIANNERTDTVKVKYIKDKISIEVEPILRNTIFVANTKQYRQQKSTGEVYALASYLQGSYEEGFRTELAYRMNKSDIEKLQILSRTIPGERIVINPNITVDNQIAIVTSRSDSGILYLPTDAKSISEDDKVRYLAYPNILIVKDSYNKKTSLEFIEDSYNNDEVVFTKVGNTPTLVQGVNLLENENGSMLGMEYESKIRLTLENGQQYNFVTDALGNVEIKDVQLEKGLGKATLNLKYLNGETYLSLKNIQGENTIYNINVEHLDPSNDVRRIYNLKLDIKNKKVKKELGELDIIISARYNSAQNSPIIFKEKVIEYPSESIDVNILSGDNPETNKTYEVNAIAESGEVYPIGVNNPKIITLNTRATQSNFIEISLDRNNEGHLILKPRYWNDSSQGYFLLQYVQNGVIVGSYKFNVKCPGAFVAMTGQLDFGKVEKGKINVTKTELLKLYYNKKNKNVSYLIDVGDIKSPTNGKDTDILYLDDNEKLKVKLELGKESGQDLQEVTLPLIGTILETKDVPVGAYQKTMQLIIKIE